MITKFLFIFFCFQITAYSKEEIGNFNPSKTKLLIIDSDAGVDDGVAILNFLGAEDIFNEIQVKFITTVSGNTHVDNVGRNILKILQTVNRLDIPVYKGANESLLITPEFENYFGFDGFGDFDYPNPPSENLIQKEHAVHALIKAASEGAGKITLVCLGPLTNIALAIKLDPNFLSKFKDIYVLGGSDSGVGNVKPGVEFNIYFDPEAAFIVFKSAEKNNKEINLVTWETAKLRNVVDMNWRKNVLGSINTPQVKLINNAERSHLKGSEWVSADTLLSAVVIDNSIIESSNKYHIDVEVCGLYSKGVTLVDYGFSPNLNRNINVLKEINVEKYKEMLLQNFDPVGGATNGASSNF